MLVQALHDLRVREQVVQGYRILRSWRAEAKPVRVEAKLLPGGAVMSHAETLSGAWVRTLPRDILAWARPYGVPGASLVSWRGLPSGLARR